MEAEPVSFSTKHLVKDQQEIIDALGKAINGVFLEYAGRNLSPRSLAAFFGYVLGNGVAVNNTHPEEVAIIRQTMLRNFDDMTLPGGSGR